MWLLVATVVATLTSYQHKPFKNTMFFNEFCMVIEHQFLQWFLDVLKTSISTMNYTNSPLNSIKTIMFFNELCTLLEHQFLRWSRGDHKTSVFTILSTNSTPNLVRTIVFLHELCMLQKHKFLRWSGAVNKTSVFYHESYTFPSQIGQNHNDFQ